MQNAGLPPRVERVIAAIGGPSSNAPLGETLGELYIGEAFSALAQARARWATKSCITSMTVAASSTPSASSPTGGSRPPPHGHQVLGQKISDFGGTWMACDGLQIALQRKRAEGVAVPVVQGQTPEQRFFMINALVWRSKMRQQALVNQLRTGQHPPGRNPIYPIEVESPLLCTPGVADCAV